MAKTNYRDKETLSKLDTSAVYGDTSETSQSRTSPEPNADDLIVSLSSAYENQRARQVFEWESTRRASGGSVLR